jgi:tRNA (cytidine/uridine-2'-O-)-methyltransferase
MFFFSAKGKRCYTDIEYPDGAFLVFGKESVGLPRELLLENSEKTVRIPMLDERRCLNLSNTVAVAAYEVLRQWNFEGLKLEGNI